MKLKYSSVVFLFVSLVLSTTPLQQVNGKELYPAGNPDLIISVGRSDGFGIDNLYVPKENLGLLIEDFTKMPVLVRETILPEIIKQFVKYQDTLTNDYVENIQVVYNMNDNSLDILIIAHPDFPGCNLEGCAHQIVKLNPPAEARMSVINHLWMFISVYANVTSYGENSVIDAVQKDVLRRTQVLATQAKITLNAHMNELLSNAIEGEGSLANKVPIQRIVLRILEDMVRVTVIFPQEENGKIVKPVDEIKTRVNLYPEFESVILGDPEIVTGATRQSSSAVAGNELVVRSEVENRMPDDQRFTYVVQVNDENGITVALNSVEDSVQWNESTKVALAWTPESAGTYEIMTFLWSDFASPSPLSQSRNANVTVRNDVMDVEHSYDNFPITTYIGFPENKQRYRYCVPIDSNGETCDSFIGYKEYSLTLFSEKSHDIKLDVENVPNGMWVKLLPQQLNVGPNGATARLIVAGGGGLPFTSPTPDTQSLIIQAESNDERTTIGDLSVRTNIPHLTILNSPRPIELPEKIDVSGGSSFRVFGAVYDPDEPSNSMSVNLSVLGLLQEGKIVPLPSWLEVDILDSSFSLNASQPHYFVIKAARTSSTPLGDHTVVIEEMVDRQRFTQNLQIKVMEPTRLGS